MRAVCLPVMLSLLVAVPALSQHPPERLQHHVRIVVDLDRIHFQGEPAGWDHLPAHLENLPDRRNTVLELAAATDLITLRQLHDAHDLAEALVREHGLLRLAYVGVQAAESRGGDPVARFDPFGQIQAGDLLRISFHESAALPQPIVRHVRVDRHGQARPPFARPLRLVNLDTDQAEATIAAAYRREQISQHAVITVERIEEPPSSSFEPGPVQPGDLVYVEVFELTGPGTIFGRFMRVRETGRLALPMLEQPVRIAGMTEIQAEQAIAQAYNIHGILRDAEVSVLRVSDRRQVRPQLLPPPAPAAPALPEEGQEEPGPVEP